MGAVGSFGAMLFNGLAGALISHAHGYSLVFLIAGVLHPVSFLIVLTMVRIAPITVAGRGAGIAPAR
jgi:hypothetical protein